MTSKITSALLADSVALTGTPTAPDAPDGVPSDQIANTRFVVAAINEVNARINNRLNKTTLSANTTLDTSKGIHDITIGAAFVLTLPHVSETLLPASEELTYIIRLRTGATPYAVTFAGIGFQSYLNYLTPTGAVITSPVAANKMTEIIATAQYKSVSETNWILRKGASNE